MSVTDVAKLVGWLVALGLAVIFAGTVIGQVQEAISAIMR